MTLVKFQVFWLWQTSKKDLEQSWKQMVRWDSMSGSRVSLLLCSLLVLQSVWWLELREYSCGISNRNQLCGLLWEGELPNWRQDRSLQISTFFACSHFSQRSLNLTPPFALLSPHCYPIEPLINLVGEWQWRWNAWSSRSESSFKSLLSRLGTKSPSVVSSLD